MSEDVATIGLITRRSQVQILPPLPLMSNVWRRFFRPSRVLGE
jgi:hypothetical protein